MQLKSSGEIEVLLNKAFEYYRVMVPQTLSSWRLGRGFNLLEIFKHLPKTNCEECGEQGCFPFAVKLANGERTLQECAQIQQPKYSGEKACLERILQPIKLEVDI